MSGSMTGKCRVCGGTRLVPTIERARLPAMQNYVYRELTAAKNAPRGRFWLTHCSQCGFAQNELFDPDRVRYDHGYDNSVSTDVMAAYYREIATYLGSRFDLDDGLLVDVGCGKGMFLQQAGHLYPRMRGLGIDPSYDGPETQFDGRIRFVKETFSGDHVDERPSLVVCRHVVEHIFAPISFLRSLHVALSRFPGVPFFLEVSDLRWILENDAYWDFCYEHCNYFAPVSLSAALSHAGFQPSQCREGFGGQYLWVEAFVTDEAKLASTQNTQREVRELCDGILVYAENEDVHVREMKGSLQQLKEAGSLVALWGMATKGIMFSLMLDGDGSLFDFCIDVNKNKQGCFVPLSGHVISAPEALGVIRDRPITTMVMNPNYLGEIQQKCAEMELATQFIDASGRRLT